MTVVTHSHTSDGVEQQRVILSQVQGAEDGNQDITGLKSKCRQGCDPSGSFRVEDPGGWILMAADIAWLAYHSDSRLRSHSTLSASVCV